ncbi:MAG TPA: (d)CMP kinase [Acholeplasmatales bacterium]|nr:MAG: cytidylate kinase [Tenericutes bacterium GWF2_57_13]HAQ57111.1 (d)CMP kinase [Acholeplasmatales bacterium]
MKRHALAIDGPAGAGKSTVAKMLAERLGYVYIDTGAMYRAATYKALKLRIDLNDPDGFGFLADTDMTFVDSILYLDGENVGQSIRSAAVTTSVSIVASHIQVRNQLVAIQQEIARNADVVMDGRDIGTVVLPDADLKIYMTATVEERARRRHEENLANGRDSDLLKIQKDIERRDRIDSTRIYNPLKQAEDAVYLDTSHLDIKAVADTIYVMFTKITSGDIVKGENHNG